MVTLQDAKDVSQIIVDKMSPLFISVFGSVARFGQGNDLDLLVVTDKAPNTQKEDWQKLRKLLFSFEHNYDIDSLVIPRQTAEKHYANGSPLLKAIFIEGRTLYMRDAIKDWFKQAETDLASAKCLLNGGFYQGACYFGHQSLEKSLKSKLLAKQWLLEKTHSIEKLSAYCADYKIELNLSEDDINLMESIYEGRCRGEMGLLPFNDPTEQDAKLAISIAEKAIG